MKLKIALLAACAALLALPVAAADERDPYTAHDDSWISLTGDVAWVNVEEFVLDYGDGLITVEMDDWDWFDEASRVNPGEKVTVYGRIDDGLYEARTIEADSVYVYDRNTYFYANDADEESYYYTYPHVWTGMPDGSWMSLSGTVASVSGREFMLDTGSGEIQVDTSALGYNPLDDVGYQQLDVGDRVSVTGELDRDFFERKEVIADTVVTLSRDATRKTSRETDSD